MIREMFQEQVKDLHALKVAKTRMNVVWYVCTGLLVIVIEIQSGVDVDGPTSAQKHDTSGNNVTAAESDAAETQNTTKKPSLISSLR